MTRCPHPERILYTLRRGTRTGDVVCGPCLEEAGGRRLLLVGDDNPAPYQAARWPRPLLLRQSA